VASTACPGPASCPQQVTVGRTTAVSNATGSAAIGGALQGCRATSTLEDDLAPSTVRAADVERGNASSDLLWVLVTSSAGRISRP
jgi:hypothetical protein